MLDEKVEAKLAAYIDGKLPPEQSREIEQQLSKSPRQLRMVKEMRQAKLWMRQMPRASLPEEWAGAMDPMAAGLERNALLGEARDGRGFRWFSPQTLGLAAALALVSALVVSMVLILPDDDTNVAVKPPVNTTPTPMPTVDLGGSDDPEGPAEVETPIDDNQPDVPDEPVETLPDDNTSSGTMVAGGIDPAAREPAETAGRDPDDPLDPDNYPDLPTLPRGAVTLIASVDDLVAAQHRINLALGRTANGSFGVRPQAVQSLPFSTVSRLNSLTQLPAGGQVLDEPDNFVFVVSSIDRKNLAQMLPALTGGRPLVIAEPQRNADRNGPVAGAANDGFNRNPEDRAEQARREKQRRDREARELEESKMLFPGDQVRLVLTLRPEFEVPPGIDEKLRGLLDSSNGQIDLTLTVDARGQMNLDQLGLRPREVLGKVPGKLADEIIAELFQDWSVATQGFANLRRRSEPPGGRTMEALELIRLDARPFKAGDLLRVTMPDDTELETVIARDGTFKLGVLGTFAAENRPAGDVQDDIVAALADTPHDAFQYQIPDPAPPTVANLTARFEAERDDRARDLIPAVIVLRQKRAIDDEELEDLDLGAWLLDD